MKYFRLEELTDSDYATKHNIKNKPRGCMIRNLLELVKYVLDPAREALGESITVNSGYRSLFLNNALNGARNSQHLLGQAADLDAGDKEANKRLFEIIRDSLPFDQLINEQDYSWIHVSYKHGMNRKQTLTIE